jgi:HK97 gp10 family phage protein
MGSVNVRLDKRKLEQLRSAGGKQAVRKALGTLAFEYQKKAGDLMRMPKSGFTYRVPGTKNATHIASAPGQAPAIMTGKLINAIEAEPVGDGTKTWVVKAGTEYAGYLEFGTRDMQPRPFMRPSAEYVRTLIEKVFKAAFDEVV